MPTGWSTPANAKAAKARPHPTSSPRRGSPRAPIAPAGPPGAVTAPALLRGALPGCPSVIRVRFRADLAGSPVWRMNPPTSRADAEPTSRSAPTVPRMTGMRPRPHRGSRPVAPRRHRPAGGSPRLAPQSPVAHAAHDGDAAPPAARRRAGCASTPRPRPRGPAPAAPPPARCAICPGPPGSPGRRARRAAGPPGLPTDRPGHTKTSAGGNGGRRVSEEGSGG